MRCPKFVLVLVSGMLVAGCGEMAPRNDSQFVTDMAVGGMTEVRLGELASKNGERQDVKDFGKKMVADHGKANNELMDLAKKKGWTLPADIDSKHQAVVDKLSKLSGKDFDKQYISDMIDDHEKDVKMVKDSLPKLSDADLKAWANNALPVMEGHLEEIKAISKK